ncbi:Tfp pilus assembly protein FimT/FimU [Photobacterium sp. 1_MG-2023]|uniref:pilus assembly FimT family protein n=1 Tax=Photobacterium sp. 1_MG-2023 TaxID=3062646 RepID=UPI0026E22C4E|nr:GspH/FimT family pseudopilin [Photobacterium sp. 1_MG-2023]MDO6704688.1 prepilin-type N-terminal cleavage/methylation domain-containing protein [Photobacterium sp. 1_MG-2023]
MAEWETTQKTAGLRGVALQRSARQRGLTLLELSLVLTLMMILAMSVVPSFSAMLAQQRLQRLVTELEWLLVQAKSESVMRGEPVQLVMRGVHHVASAGREAEANWQIAVNSATQQNLLKTLSGEGYPALQLSRSFSEAVVPLDPLTGRPHAAGSLYVRQSGQDEVVRITFSNVTGRIYVCASRTFADYAAC